MTQKEFFHALLKIRYFRGDAFTLDAVTEKTISSMQSRYPDNQHLEAKIRQLLQELRDDGELEFLGGATYRLLRRGRSAAQFFGGAQTEAATGLFETPPDGLLAKWQEGREKAVRPRGISQVEWAAEMAKKYIEQNGGVIAAVELTEHLQEKHDFPPRRSRRLFTAPLFVLEHDLVRLRRPDEPYPVTEDAGEQLGVLILQDRIIMLREAGSDLRLLTKLPARAAVLTAFGVQPGESRAFQTILEPLRVYWPIVRGRGDVSIPLANLRYLSRKKGDHVILQFNLVNETLFFS